MIPLGIELGRGDGTVLHSLIISAAHAEGAYYHKEECEVGEPRYHRPRQDVITQLIGCHISLHVHQHDAYSCIGTKPIQRRIILSLWLGGVNLLVMRHDSLKG